MSVILSPYQVELAQKHFEWFAENCVWIVNKKQNSVRFKLNPTQKKILTKLLGKEKVRLIIIKPRQRGVSTLICMFGLWRMLFRPNFEVRHYLHKHKYVRGFVKKYDHAYYKLPQNLRSPSDKCNTYDIQFPDLGSYAFFYTAGTGGGASRSETMHLLHLSEPAEYMDLPSIMTAAVDAIPSEPFTYIILESTPKGIEHDFAKMYFAAKKEEGSKYDYIFFPWFEEDDLSIHDNEIIELDDEERALVKSYGVSIPHLKWRRDKLGEYPGTEQEKIQIFNSQYPTNDVDCWTAGMFCFFNATVVKQHIDCVESDIKSGDLQQEFGTGDLDGLIIYERPIEGEEYGVGADCSEGIDVGDFSAIVVWKKSTGDQVAQYNKRIGHFDFAKKINAVGRWYNNAKVTVELNNHGHAVVGFLYENFSYPNLYQDSSGRISRATTVLPKFVSRMGFVTSEGRKKDIMNRFAEALFLGDAKPNNLEFLRQLMYYEEKNGKLSAPQGDFDDVLMAGVIGWFGLSSVIPKIEIFIPKYFKVNR